MACQTGFCICVTEHGGIRHGEGHGKPMASLLLVHPCVLGTEGRPCEEAEDVVGDCTGDLLVDNSFPQPELLVKR